MRMDMEASWLLPLTCPTPNLMCVPLEIYSGQLLLSVAFVFKYPTQWINQNDMRFR